MTRIIHIFIFLFFCSIMEVCAFGKSEAKYRRELDQYPIRVSPISLPGSIAYEHVYISSDKILLRKKSQLIEVNLTNNEQKIIETPENWTVVANYGRFTYDMSTNSVHMIYSEKNMRRFLYYILHLDNYTWETIEELGFIHPSYWYDSINKHIYVIKDIKKELYPENTETNTKLFFSMIKFDLAKREFLECIEMPQGTWHIYSIYENDNSLKIIADIQNDKNIYRHLFIFDAKIKERTDFPEITTNINTGFFRMRTLIPLKENRHFLGDVYGKYGSRIVVMNLDDNTIETVALHDFPYEIYNFKKNSEGKYSFIVMIRNRGGFLGPQFLCFLDLDIA